MSEDKKRLKDVIRKRLISLGVVATTMAPVASANASNEISRDDVKANKIEMVDFTILKNELYSNEGDSIIDEHRGQTFKIVDKNGFLEHHQEEKVRSDVLDNGYTMIRISKEHYKNGNVKDCDTNLVLRTPDGREVNCDFLEKFDFTTSGTITYVATGITERITEEYAKSSNDLNENRAKAEIMKKVKNPEDRKAMMQYVHRLRMEMDDFGCEHTVMIMSKTSEYTSNLQSSPKKVKNETKNFKNMMKRQIRDFYD